MIKVRAKEDFTLARFAETKDVVRNNQNYCKEGMFYKGDIFVCNEDLVKYLTNEIENPVKRAVVEVVEIIPEKQEVKKEEKKEEPKKADAKKSTIKRKKVL